MYNVGYTDTKAFRTTFKKITGLVACAIPEQIQQGVVCLAVTEFKIREYFHALSYKRKDTSQILLSGVFRSDFYLQKRGDRTDLYFETILHIAQDLRPNFYPKPFMQYKRMPIEKESPEETGYSNILYNLAESSVTDLQFHELDLLSLDTA